MKNLIAQMDAIEQGKKFIAESAATVVEYKGGTDQEKIKNWQDHIKNFDNFPKAQDDARQAAKKAQPGAKFYKTDDKPKKEGMGSIARALMQDMGIEEEGNYPLDQQQYVQRGDVPAGPGMSDPMAALKHAWKYRTDPQGNLIGSRAKAQLDNPDPATSGDANIGGAANAGAAPAAAEPDVGTPELNIGQGATPAPAPTPAVTNPATDPNTNPGKPTTGSEMDTPAPAGITPASSGAASAQPPNRDTMPFGKAFADAKAKGEKVFTWKGKQYAVKMANAPKSGSPAAAPAAPVAAPLTQGPVESVDLSMIRKLAGL